MNTGLICANVFFHIPFGNAACSMVFDGTHFRRHHYHGNYMAMIMLIALTILDIILSLVRTVQTRS